VVSVDAMIKMEYRGFSYLYHMCNAAFKYMEEREVFCVFAFPNDASHEVYIKSKLYKSIGDLTIYCLPYRIGGVKHRLKIFNIFSIAFVKLLILFTFLLSSEKVHRFVIEKETVSYNATRYKRLDGNYHIVSHRGNDFVYKLMEYEGIRSAFLVDVVEKSSRNFNKAVQYIIKKHRKEFDILLYVGHLPFKFHGMIALPKKLSPKNFHFVGRILGDNKMNPDFVFNIDHWDVNLSNYDLL
jgi:hypothetical protein